jgi:BirA family biotin operon repressor/biotin-[acetyl-CoA-carboxylase] ligase
MPANLVAQTLRGGLYTRVVGRRVLFYQELPSTMDEAARLAQAGAAGGTVVVAETQTASRGRLGRTWVSRPGNLYLSVVFRPSLQDLPSLSCLGAVAVVRAIRQATGLNPRLKWPNDVLLSGKKVAGVLVESAIQGEQLEYAVLGIGINVGLDLGEIPPDPPLQRGEGRTLDSLPYQGGDTEGVVLSQATSLNAQAGQEVPRDALLRHLLHALDRLYVGVGSIPVGAHSRAPLQGGVMEEWRGLLDTLGQRVQVSAANPDVRAHSRAPLQGATEVAPGDATLTGLAEGVDGLGNLLLRLDDGRLLTLTAGDVTLAGSVT